ncbi:leucine-rich repeat domain-containing protein [Pseudomonas sp. GL-B-26]|uniref:leucine-rich repeat domain-containing protein n=1 Tax=unclassified Pseudomonas TaxID=196821 RepID=UPI001CBCA9E4|nr:leucine-rich repeat domain-containing protein [Pseudomonas sp. GL-B-26]
MTDYPHKDDNAPTFPGMREELKSAVDAALPQTPGQFGGHLIKQKWGQDIDPTTAQLVTLDYDYVGRSAQNGVHQGRVASSMSLAQVLISNYQTVGDGRFGETAFGLYTPPDVGPSIVVTEHVDELAEPGNDYHHSYEGIYRRTVPQRYGPLTQIAVRPADFKKWVWELNLQDRYQAYLDQAWPSDEVIVAPRPHALKTSAKAAFVMAALLQQHENSLTPKGSELAMQAAGLPSDQAWATLTVEQLQTPTRVPAMLKTGRLKLYRYTAEDIWGYRDPDGRILLYIPGNSSPLHLFDDSGQLHQWVVKQGRHDDTKQALAAHFAEDDRKDGTFHAGVLTALDGMAVYPKVHRLRKEAGFFNDDGLWEPAGYIGFDDSPSGIDPFAQLVLTMKEASRASVKTIRDDAQVNRDNLSAVVEPVVQWINRFGPLALFVPGGEGLLVLAGIIDAGYGLDQAVNGATSSDRASGVTRTVFGLLNALPLAGAGVALKSEATEAGAIAERVHEPGVAPREEVARPTPDLAVAPTPGLSNLILPTRVELLRGIGPSVASFSDEMLAQIGKVSTVDDDMLRLMQAGRPPTPLLADTISRFRIDQELGQTTVAQGERVELFNSRYEALQHSEHEWGRLFQRQYPGLPKSAIEQMLDRYGIDIQSPPEAAQVRQSFGRLDSKARQYQQHVRFNRAYEGLYLRSVVSPESDTLALHSLKNLPGWPKSLRIEVHDSSLAGRVLDRSGAFDAASVRRLIKVGNRYQSRDVPTGFYEVVLEILSGDEREGLQLSSLDPARELRLKVGERAMPRSELVLGLGRMDSGLPFEAQGLRGGGYPGTPQAEGLTHEMMRLQLKELYPDFSNAEADELLQRAGGNAQVHIDQLKQQFQQLNIDLSGWIDQVAEDIEDMDIPFLNEADNEAQGLTDEQIEEHNADMVRNTMHYERETRTELADELIALWQKRASQDQRVYSGGQLVGFKLDLAGEDYHRLPVMNIRFNEVVELSMPHFHVTERETLSGFLECFPNLQTLNLESAELTQFDAEGRAQTFLPTAMFSLTHLTSLNLRATGLVFTQETASQLTGLVRLHTLDLSENPLSVPPVLLGMNDLRQLNLSDTQITRCPIGIRDEPYMISLDLRDNRITRVPPAVMNQAVSVERVQLWGNPLTDEDTLRRLISHREQTGINLWLSAPSADYGQPIVWLRDCDEPLQQSRQALWQRLAGKPSGTRFLGVIDRLSLIADFQVSYLSIQARVWRLLEAADLSDAVWSRLSAGRGRFENPLVAFRALEQRAGL